jgi:hypothetical protein
MHFGDDIGLSFVALHQKSVSGTKPNSKLTNSKLTNSKLTNSKLTNSKLTNSKLTNSKLLLNLGAFVKHVVDVPNHSDA